MDEEEVTSMKMETDSTKHGPGEQAGRLLTPAELATALGVGVRTVRRMTRDGLIPCIQVGVRRPRYLLADVLAALIPTDTNTEGE